MPYILAVLSGLLLSLMVYFNGQLGASTTFYWGSVLFHCIGLFFFSLTLSFTTKSKKVLFTNDFKDGAFFIVLPGILSAFTIVLSNLSLTHLGVTLMVGISLLGQVITSLLIDAMGILGKQKSLPNLNQWMGTALLFLGLWIFMG